MNSENVGFFYMIFQANPSKNRVKAFVDGEDIARSYSFDEIVELAKQANLDVPLIRRSLSSYSFYLWNIDEATISPIVVREGKRSIQSFLGEAKQQGIREQKTDNKPGGSLDFISERYHQVDIELDPNDSPML